MALFLSESVGYTKSISLEEALIELHSIAMEGGVLTESLLRADFIIHEQSRNLSETDEATTSKEVKVNKEMGFFAKAWEAIKAFCKKVWMVIKRICKAIWEKLKMYWNKITGNNGNITKPKKDIEIARLKLALAQELTIISERTYPSVEDIRHSIENVAVKYEHKIANAEKLTGTIEITKDELAQLFSAAKQTTENVDKANEATNNEVDKVDGEIKAGKPEAKAQAEVAKEKKIAIQRASAGAAAAVVALAPPVVLPPPMPRAGN
jgi:hypothetical protein